MARYLGRKNYQHGIEPSTGILIANLGTPEQPTTAALRRYLREFLADPRVVEIPRLIWWFILHGIILRIRPARSARAYKSVWTEEGSPLLANSKKQLNALTLAFKKYFAGQVNFKLAMRYGEPSIKKTLRELQDSNIERLLILPLYPQYSSTTTGSVFDAVSTELMRWREIPELRFIKHYHDFQPYISAMATHIKHFWQQHGRPEKILFSFHGIPKRYLLNGDPYHCECHKTARLLAESLQLTSNEWQLIFQSRFGREEWLQPYADKTLTNLPASGIRHVQIFCPGFAVDCLETLEEMAIENKNLFLEAGGKQYDYIPALNSERPHITALTQLIKEHCIGWETALISNKELTSSLNRARDKGAMV